jgi:hypothetical protein
VTSIVTASKSIYDQYSFVPERSATISLSADL